MESLEAVIYILIAVAGTGVVATRDPLPQTIAVSFYGLLVSILFMILHAPDVALSELVIGAAAYPLMVVIAIAKTTGRGAE